MRIAHANAVYDAAAKTPGELLDRYRTLTEWSAALARAGAPVTVIQRFRSTAHQERDGVNYEFVADKQPPWLSTRATPEEFIKAIAAQSPDVVHVNGLIFPQLVAGIRAAVGGKVAIVVQHHAGEYPIRGSGLVGMWQRQRWRKGLAAADAISFTAAEQADQWRTAGLLADQRIIHLVEASTTMREVNRDRARTAIGTSGDPVILWIGRLTSNTDPITILDGLERALPQLRSARVMMLFGDDTLLASVEQRVRESAILNAQVQLIGRISPDELPNYFGAADVFVSGSLSEGNDSALIEAMSAGIVPVVTDIPSFRAIAGDCGARFPPGEAGGFATALLRVCSADLPALKAATKAHFARELSWDAVASRTVEAYQTVLDARRSK